MVKLQVLEGVSAELVSVVSEDVVDIYHSIITAIWAIGYVPRQWCKTAIVPIHKNDSKKGCESYQSINLTSHQTKFLTEILLLKIQAITAHVVNKYQAGFRPGRSTIDQIFTVRQLMERYIDFERKFYQLFIDFRQTCDLIWRKGLWHILQHYGIPDKIFKLVEDTYNEFKSQIMTTYGLSDEFSIISGVLQGCTLSTYLSNLFLVATLSLIPAWYEAKIDPTWQPSVRW